MVSTQPSPIGLDFTLNKIIFQLEITIDIIFNIQHVRKFVTEYQCEFLYYLHRLFFIL